jgi:hypothetical protein
MVSLQASSLADVNDFLPILLVTSDDIWGVSLDNSPDRWAGARSSNVNTKIPKYH